MRTGADLTEASLTNKWSTTRKAMEVYKHIEKGDYDPIDKAKNPFVLIEVSRMLHGGSDQSPSTTTSASLCDC